MTRGLLLALSTAALGCGGPPRVICEAPEQVLAQVDAALLACTDVDQAVRYIELAAARPMDRADRERVAGVLADAFRANPTGTTERIDKARHVVGAVAALEPLGDKLARRATTAWEIHKGQGAFAGLEEMAAIEKRALAVWSFDDTEKLALTESDIEGWLSYASLCREVQGGTPLRISVADRLVAYKIVQDRWESADRTGKLGLVGLGGVWSGVTETWQDATYDEQQAWIRSAPLPPPMTATSLAYLEAVLEGDVGLHARTLHAMLGPFPVHGLN